MTTNDYSTITLAGPTHYNPRFPPAGAKKGYVAKITGRAEGPAKYSREFLGQSVTLVDETDVGLYERQIGEKKGGFTRYYHVVLQHPEHGMIKSTDCEDELPKIARLLDEGISIADAVEITDLRPSERDDGVWIFDAVARRATDIKKEARAGAVDAAVAACVGALEGLDERDRKKAVIELRKRLAAHTAA